MTFHLAAFHELIDPAGILSKITAVQDNTVFTSGDDIRVPGDLPFIIGEGCLLEATAPVQAQVQSPSLRRLANLDIAPLNTGLVFAEQDGPSLHYTNPVPVTADEAINFAINSNPAAATDQYGLVWFGDGAQSPLNADIFTIRATVAVTAVTGSWENANIAFDEDLPVGNYDVVGLRVIEATGVAARLNFVGGAWRPGVVIADSVTRPDVPGQRRGMMGIWGTFHTNTPPTIDVLAAAGALTPVVYMDLIARG